MLTSTIKRNAFRVLATFAFAAAPAFASMIIVNNFSFELPLVSPLATSCGVGCSYEVAAIQDWGGSTGVSTAVSRGRLDPGTTAGWFTSLSAGPTSAWANDGI